MGGWRGSVAGVTDQPLSVFFTDPSLPAAASFRQAAQGSSGSMVLSRCSRFPISSGAWHVGRIKYKSSGREGSPATWSGGPWVRAAPRIPQDPDVSQEHHLPCLLLGPVGSKRQCYMKDGSHKNSKNQPVRVIILPSVSLFLLCWFWAQLNAFCVMRCWEFILYVRLTRNRAWGSTILAWPVAPQPLPVDCG